MMQSVTDFDHIKMQLSMMQYVTDFDDKKMQMSMMQSVTAFVDTMMLMSMMQSVTDSDHIKIDRTSVKLMSHLRKMTKLTKWKSDKN